MMMLICSQTAQSCPSDSVTGILSGRILNEGVPVPYATIGLLELRTGTTSDEEGDFEMELPQGKYTLVVSCIGFEKKKISNIEITRGNNNYISIEMKATIEFLDVVEVSVNLADTKTQAVLSLTSIDKTALLFSAGTQGGDVAQLFRSISGISSPIGWTSEIFVRGGLSFENKYYLNGARLAVFNHFNAPGTGSGVKSIVNGEILEKINVYKSSFPIEREGALSGLFDLKLSDEVEEHPKGYISLSSTEATAVLSTPLAEKLQFTGSIRRSYLKPTLRLLGRPIAPEYFDAQYFLNWKKSPRVKMSYFGLISRDNVRQNIDINRSPINNYYLSIQNVARQELYMNSLTYRYLEGNFSAKTQLAVSVLKKKSDRRESPFLPNSAIVFDSEVHQQDITLNQSFSNTFSNLELHYGSNLIYHRTDINLFHLHQSTDDKSDLEVFTLRGFFKANQFLMNRKILCVLSVDFKSSHVKNTIELANIAPHFALSYFINPHLSLNAQFAKYAELPDYFILANQLGFATPEKRMAYIQSDQLGASLEYNNKALNQKITLELFHKTYNNYPINERIGLPLPLIYNIGFVPLGGGAIIADGKGKSTGLELNLKKSWNNRFYLDGSYTLSETSFQKDGNYINTTTDSRHIIQMKTGYFFEKPKLRVGLYWRFQSGLPYTDYDIAQSSMLSVWRSSLGIGVFDHSNPLTNRTDAVSELNLRLDKELPLANNTSLAFYIDVNNILNQKSINAPLFITYIDEQGIPIADSQNPQQVQYFISENQLSTFLPSLGLKWTY